MPEPKRSPSTDLAARLTRVGRTTADGRPVTARRGEHLAAMHLRHRGYELLARNARMAAGEIDLIARRGDVVVFVEVKTARIPRADGSRVLPVPQPLEGLRHRQRRRIRRAAGEWLRAAALSGRPATIRFDAIGVVVDCRWELHRLDHVEGAW